MSICFTEDDMPGTYHDADCASLGAQRRYIRLFATMLSTSVLAALCSWLASLFPAHRTIFDAAALVSGVSAFVLTFVIQIRKYEDTWYIGRAIAESIKTRSWKYMMNAEPYGRNLSDQAATARFISDIRKILDDNTGPLLERAPGKTREEITQAMRMLRSQELAARLETYRVCRIVDQRDWYGRKASDNKRKEGQLFTLVLVCQFAASVAALIGLIEKEGVSDLVAIFASIGTGFLAWLQVKKYQETAKAYAVASHELSLTEALVPNIATESEMSVFVNETESAVSREHTLWIARRVSRE